MLLVYYYTRQSVINDTAISQVHMLKPLIVLSVIIVIDLNYVSQSNIGVAIGYHFGDAVV